MSTEPRQKAKQPWHHALLKRIGMAIVSNWKLKLLSLLVAVVVWGALISEDASLTREKTFTDVPVIVSGTEALQRNGLIIVEGLDNLAPIKMRVQVPQKAYNTAMPTNYSVRVDVSRITETGEQSVSIQTLSTATFGTVEWLSTNEIKVVVDEYITRRRVPVRLVKNGQTPEGYYSASATADPSNVVISGPRSLVEKVAMVSASYTPAMHDSISGVQYNAVPFKLMTIDNKEVDGSLISVTSENVLLDTLLVEQVVYPTKQVDINLTGILKGKLLEGYEVVSVKSDPASIRIAGDVEELAGIQFLDLSSGIDVTGVKESLIRALRVEKPPGVVHMSDNAVYITVEIAPLAAPQGD